MFTPTMGGSRRLPATTPVLLRLGSGNTQHLTSTQDKDWQSTEGFLDMSRFIRIRTVARGLEKHLFSFEDSALHWISVIGESSTNPGPGIRLMHADMLCQVGLESGLSEGCLLTIGGRMDRYRWGENLPLMLIKLLCSPKTAHKELVRVHDWLASSAHEKLTEAFVDPSEIDLNTLTKQGWFDLRVPRND
jgi:hypothetical protein